MLTSGDITSRFCPAASIIGNNPEFYAKEPESDVIVAIFPGPAGDIPKAQSAMGESAEVAVVVEFWRITPDWSV